MPIAHPGHPRYSLGSPLMGSRTSLKRHRDMSPAGFNLLQFDQNAQALFEPFFRNTNPFGVELMYDFGQDKGHLSPLRSNEKQDAFVDE